MLQRAARELWVPHAAVARHAAAGDASGHDLRAFVSGGAACQNWSLGGGGHGLPGLGRQPRGCSLVVGQAHRALPRCNESATGMGGRRKSGCC